MVTKKNNFRNGGTNDRAMDRQAAHRGGGGGAGRADLAEVQGRLLAKSKPSDDAVKKLHEHIDAIAKGLYEDSTDVFRALLAKLIEQPEEKQTFERLLEMAE